MNVIDTHRTNYEIISEIGKGSQGSTYLVRGGKYLVKLFNDTVNPEEMKSKVHFLKQLDLNKEDFAVPLEEISQPKIGYLAEFASGMEPLSSLQWSNQSENLQEWFINTGGILKRFQVLIKLAERIRALHSKGLIYCDLSPSNVFVSSSPRSSHVFMIDLDNLRYKTSLIHNIYTPFYAAPELVNSTLPNSMSSDCFSFAVIAYELLTLSHPLIGDYVSEGDPELEEQALAGKLPWVEHSKDDTNSRSSGIPSEFFVTGLLAELFKRTFEDGLNKPELRPTISEWYDSLYKVLNDLINCPLCGIHYPYNKNRHACPFCSNVSDSIVRLQMKRWEKVTHYDKERNNLVENFELAPFAFEEIIIDKHTTKYIKRSHFLLPGSPNDPVMQVRVIEAAGEERLLEVIPKNMTFYAALDAEELFQFNTPKKIRLSRGRHKELIFGTKKLDTPQRVITIV